MNNAKVKLIVGMFFLCDQTEIAKTTKIKQK